MNDVHMNGVHIRSMALWKQVGGRLAGKDPERSTLLFRREGGAMSSKKAISRNRIIEVAFGMARESGLPSLSVRAIAEACGVATGTIYNHVPERRYCSVFGARRSKQRSSRRARAMPRPRWTTAVVFRMPCLARSRGSAPRGSATWGRSTAGRVSGPWRRSEHVWGTCTRRSGTHSRGTRLSPAGLAIAFKWMRWWTSPGRRCSTR